MKACGDNMNGDKGSINFAGNHIGFESFKLIGKNTRKH